MKEVKTGVWRSVNWGPVITLCILIHSSFAPFYEDLLCLYTLLILLYFSVTLFPCCPISVFCCFYDALSFWCTLFMLHFFHFAFFSFCTFFFVLFMFHTFFTLYSFPVPLLPYWTHLKFSPCCDFFILHSFRATLFSCIAISLTFHTLFVFYIFFTFLVFHSWLTFFRVALFSCESYSYCILFFLRFFSLRFLLFPCCTFFMLDLFYAAFLC